MRAVRRGRHDGRTAIRFFPDRDIEWHLAQERNAETLGFAPRTAVTEYVRTRAALWADECAHVFDNAEHRRVDAAKHRDAAPGVDQSEILRRRNDDRAFERHLLGHGELRIARARRHV